MLRTCRCDELVAIKAGSHTAYELPFTSDLVAGEPFLLVFNFTSAEPRTILYTLAYSNTSFKKNTEAKLGKCTNHESIRGKIQRLSTIYLCM